MGYFKGFHKIKNVVSSSANHNFYGIPKHTFEETYNTPYQMPGVDLWLQADNGIT